MPLWNNRGITIIEHVVAFMIFSILALMICTAFLVGSDLTIAANGAYDSRGTLYNDLESGATMYESDELLERSGAMIFGSYVSTVSGTYRYGDGDHQVGEFVAD